MIECLCPNCGKLLRVPDEYAGKEGKCGHCETALMVPAPANQMDDLTAGIEQALNRPPLPPIIHEQSKGPLLPGVDLLKPVKAIGTGCCLSTLLMIFAGGFGMILVGEEFVENDGYLAAIMLGCLVFGIGAFFDRMKK